jgi:hypothetical protein
VQLASERGAGIDVLREDLKARRLFNLTTMAEWAKRPVANVATTTGIAGLSKNVR